MRLAIAGCGWVTPLGSNIGDVWRRVLAGQAADVEEIASDESQVRYPVLRVPADSLQLPPHPRLRRSSAISKFSAAAGLAALRDAGIEMTPEIAARTALVFAVSNGGVIYTKRFYRDVVESGARAASPLLFPETVFNAPASHLAAILGITGASYTVVGDGAVGALAVQMAHDLMASASLDYCLVVAAEEADWLLCDAYKKWRLTRASPPIEPFRTPARGTILSEGAGAVLFTAEPESDRRHVVIDKISAGTNFTRRSEAADALDRVFRELCDETSPSIVVASANGTFIDHAERSAISTHTPNATVHTPKAVLGESVGASGVWQIICGVETLRENAAESAVVSVCGMNQQVAGLRLTRA